MKNSVKIIFTVASAAALIAFQNFGSSSNSSEVTLEGPTCAAPSAIEWFNALPEPYQYALISAQGLLNRSSPCLYLFPKDRLTLDHDTLLAPSYPDYLSSWNYLNEFTTTPKKISAGILASDNTPVALDFRAHVRQFFIQELQSARAIKGVVIYDSSRKYVTINSALNAAGLKSALVIDAALWAQLQIDAPELTKNLKVFYDFTKLFNNPDSTQTQKLANAKAWEYKNIFPGQNHSGLFINYYGANARLSIDLAIKNNYHIYWLPFGGLKKSDGVSGCQQNTDFHEDADYSPELENSVLQIFRDTGPNIPVYGWISDDDPNTNTGVGWCEHFGIGLLSAYGKYDVAAQMANNLSFHSAYASKFQVAAQPAMKGNEEALDPNANYVAFLMWDSSVSPMYYQTAFMSSQWGQQARPNFPMSWGMTPQLRKLMPREVQYLYGSENENNYFIAGQSGVGYTFLFDNYGVAFNSNQNIAYPQLLQNLGGTAQTMTPITSTIYDEYFQILDKDLAAMKMRGFESFTHINSWTAADDAFFAQNYLPRMTDRMKEILLDFGVLESLNPTPQKRAMVINGSSEEGLKPVLLRTVSQSLLPKYIPKDVTSYPGYNGLVLLPEAGGLIQGHDPLTLSFQRAALVNTSDAASIATKAFYEQMAVDMLAQQILENGGCNRFQLVQADSFHFGPDRAQKVFQELVQKGACAGNYKAVTVHELSQRLRQATLQKLYPNR